MLAKPSALDRAVAKHQRRHRKTQEKRAARQATAKAWNLLRRVIYERDRGSCRVCCAPVYFLSSNPLDLAHVHHIVYRSAGGTDATSNLVTLCPTCHDREHRHLIDIGGDGDGRITVEGHGVAVMEPRRC